jgi:hypothetical protein
LGKLVKRSDFTTDAAKVSSDYFNMIWEMAVDDIEKTGIKL